MPLPWFRFYHEWINDPKVQNLSFEWQRHFVAILCWHANGTLQSLSDEIIAESFHMSLDELGIMKKSFTMRGFIEDGWTPKNWEKRQTTVNGASTSRVRAFRERKRVSSVSCNAVTVSETHETPMERMERVSPLHETRGNSFPSNSNSDDDDELKNDLINSSNHHQELEETVSCVSETACNVSPVSHQTDIPANIDTLVEEVEQTFPGSQFPGLVYDLCKNFMPTSVEWGFREAIAMAWKGERMTIKRIKGLVNYAQENKLIPTDAMRTPTKDPRTKEYPKKKNKTELLHEELDAKRAEIRSKLPPGWKASDDDEEPDPSKWAKR